MDIMVTVPRNKSDFKEATNQIIGEGYKPKSNPLFR